MAPPPAPQVIESEFASVAVAIDDHGNGPRLRIEDLRSGHVGYLDALELETLAWLPAGALYPFLDPSRVRWSENGRAGVDPPPDREVRRSQRPSPS